MASKEGTSKHWVYKAAPFLIVGLLVVHSFPGLRGWVDVDPVSLTLLGLLILVPSMEFIKKLKVGSVEAEMSFTKEVAEATAKVLAEAKEVPGPTLGPPVPEDPILELVRRDPTLGLAKVRIELERLLTRIAESNLPPRVAVSNPVPRRRLGLGGLVDVLVGEGLMPYQLAVALKDILPLLNRAAHGERIQPDDAEKFATLCLGLMAELRRALGEPATERTISLEEVKKFESAKYRVLSITPLVTEPTLNERTLTQEELTDFLEFYDEHAEFLVSIEPIGLQVPSVDA